MLDNNKKTEILIFGGTTEGHALADLLGRREFSHIHVTLCTATEYGGEILQNMGDNITVRCSRLDMVQMTDMLADLSPEICIDATHPYAVLVSENIQEACARTDTEYIRVLRDESSYDTDNYTTVDSVEEAAELLRTVEGNVLITTGAKEIDVFCTVDRYRDRCYVRVLPVKESIDKCHELGIRADHIIAMQGPFSQKLNEILINEYDIKYLVTKESGSAGGFAEKCLAAEATGTSLILIRRPGKKINLNTMNLSEIIECLKTRYSSQGDYLVASDRNRFVQNVTEVTLVGIGPGSIDEMTVSALTKLANSDLIIGASRMIEAAKAALDFGIGNCGIGKVNICFKQLYNIDEIKECIYNSTAENISVVFSGDLGFSSGAMKLKHMLEEDGIACNIVSGLSSLPVLFNKLGFPWEQAELVTVHGRKFSSARLVSLIQEKEYVGMLPKDAMSLHNICVQLTDSSCGDVEIYIGERLSYEDENISCYSASEISKLSEIEFCFDRLSVVAFVNPHPDNGRRISLGIRDEEFLREKNSRGNLIPMTKSEVRAVIMSKLGLARDSRLWDIGAGTGSVSIRAAAILENGNVISFEKDEEAAALLEKNIAYFGLDNIELVRGDALEQIGIILERGSEGAFLKTDWKLWHGSENHLPTHLFLGGTSGEMCQIVEKITETAPYPVRIVATAVTLDTLSEMTVLAREFSDAEKLDIVQLQVSRNRRLGEHTLMQAENSVYIISFETKAR